MSDERIWTAKEAATALALSESSVRRLLPETYAEQKQDGRREWIITAAVMQKMHKILSDRDWRKRDAEIARSRGVKYW